MASAAAAPPSHLAQLVAALDAFAPFAGAAAWDNVGLLVEPVRAHEAPAGGARFGVLLTNDVTPAVLAESARAFGGRGARALVAYHPTPFSALKRFALRDAPARAVLDLAARNCALVSPHTAWDVAAPHGLNDWLIARVAGALPARCAPLAGVRPVRRAAGAAGEAGAGDGRAGALAAPATLADVAAAVKAALALETVQLSLPASLAAAAARGPAAVAAAAAAHPVRALAVAAGSGAGVLAGFAGADVWVTGEMSHHELLAAAAAGVAVVLTSHSRCERGFLAVVRARLEADLGGDFDFALAEDDADPLTTL